MSEIDLAYHMAMKEEESSQQKDTGTSLKHPTLRKGVVTTAAPLQVDDLPASNITGTPLSVGLVVWMLVDAGRRLVVGAPSEFAAGYVDVASYGLVRRSVAGNVLVSGTSALIPFNVAEYTVGPGITAVTSGSDRGFDLGVGLWLVTFKLRLSGSGAATRVQSRIDADGSPLISGAGTGEQSIGVVTTKNIIPVTAPYLITSGTERITAIGFHNAGSDQDTQHSTLSVARLARI